MLNIMEGSKWITGILNCTFVSILGVYCSCCASFAKGKYQFNHFYFNIITCYMNLFVCVFVIIKKFYYLTSNFLCPFVLWIASKLTAALGLGHSQVYSANFKQSLFWHLKKPRSLDTNLLLYLLLTVYFSLKICQGIRQNVYHTRDWLETWAWHLLHP